MSVTLNPYLSFKNNAREAIEFYHSVFGGELVISTFGDLHAAQDPVEADLIMHSMLTAPGGLVLMASDTPDRIPFNPGDTFQVSLSGAGSDDEAVLTGYWDALSEGATVAMPLAKAAWGDSFGMLSDKFGIRWIVNIASGAA